MKDPVANIYADLSSAFCTSNKNEYSLDIFVSSKNEFSELEHLLRVNYDINFVVSDGLYSQNEVRARCVILDLKNAIFTFEGNAREDKICIEQNYLSYYLSEVGYPITWDKLFIHLASDKNDKSINNVSHYIGILVTLDPNVDAIKKLVDLADQNSLFSQKTIAKKSYLYNFYFKKSKLYLIQGDKVKILASVGDWYFINYKGKKDINMWIKAEAVDFNEKE
ncbi:hypothetical protein [Lonepinella sp. MS14435]|uniref:hypothetical protein n=1 Tax=Lonepinella sp. MS14435 TaxID=3003618 RepID=UPI0036DB8F63